MTLAERVKFARQKAELSQAQLAAQIGIAQPSLHDIESGRTSSLRSSTLFRMAHVLGQTPEWLADNVGILTNSERAPFSKDENTLLESFCKLTAAEKKIVIRMVRALAIDKA